MTSTPLPPRPNPAFKLNYDSKSGWYFVSEPGVGDTWCFTSYQLDEYATQARADLEAENARLREALTQIFAWNQHPSGLAVDYGSNGVRDFYRGIANAALKGTP